MSVMCRKNVANKAREACINFASCVIVINPVFTNALKTFANSCASSLYEQKIPNNLFQFVAFSYISFQLFSSVNGEKQLFKKSVTQTVPNSLGWNVWEALSFLYLSIILHATANHFLAHKEVQCGILAQQPDLDSLYKVACNVQGKHDQIILFLLLEASRGEYT